MSKKFLAHITYRSTSYKTQSPNHSLATLVVQLKARSTTTAPLRSSVSSTARRGTRWALNRLWRHEQECL